MRPVPAPRTTRRTAIGGALLGVAALSACDPDPRSAEPTPPSTPATVDDPDGALVDALIVELDELVALVTTAADRRPLLAPDLAPFVTLHRAHRGVLPARETDPQVPRITGTPREVAEQVRLREVRARARLADWSVAAESGALARLLASMSAGVAAHLAASDLRGSIS